MSLWRLWRSFEWEGGGMGWDEWDGWVAGREGMWGGM